MENVTIQKIIFLLQKSGKKQKELTDFLGITQNAFTDWKSGRIKSYTKHLPKIADFFGVSVDYLLGVEDEKNTPDEPKLTEGEKRVLELFRDVPDDRKEVVLAMIRAALIPRE